MITKSYYTVNGDPVGAEEAAAAFSQGMMMVQAELKEANSRIERLRTAICRLYPDETQERISLTPAALDVLMDICNEPAEAREEVIR